MFRRALFTILLFLGCSAAFTQQTCPVTVLAIKAREFTPLGNPHYAGVYADPWNLYFYLWYENTSSKPIVAVTFHSKFGDVLRAPQEVPINYNDYHKIKPGKRRDVDWPDGVYSSELGSGNYGIVSLRKVVFADGSMWTATDDSCSWSNSKNTPVLSPQDHSSASTDNIYIQAQKAFQDAFNSRKTEGDLFDQKLKSFQALDERLQNSEHGKSVEALELHVCGQILSTYPQGLRMLADSENNGPDGAATTAELRRALQSSEDSMRTCVVKK